MEVTNDERPPLLSKSSAKRRRAQVCKQQMFAMSSHSTAVTRLQAQVHALTHAIQQLQLCVDNCSGHASTRTTSDAGVQTEPDMQAVSFADQPGEPKVVSFSPEAVTSMIATHRSPLTSQIVLSNSKLRIS